MKISASSLRLLHCLHLPGALLIALLQRTPAVRVIASAGESALRHPVGSLLKSTVATLGALGAVHTLAGATTLSPSTPSPAAATVGTAKTIVFTVIGAQSAGESWTVGGSVPPGMSFNGGVTSGTVNTPTGILTLSGTPTSGGNHVVSLRAWEKAGAKGEGSPTYSYTVNVSGGAAATAPAFTTHPASQTVTTGASVTLTVSATGSPSPTLQWQKNGGAIAGQTGPTLILSAVATADAGTYTCVATNSVATVTSNAAVVGISSATGSGSRISNVSVRTTLAAAQTLIVGFTMQGGSKLVVVRAVGPGLANFGVAGTMSDPRLLLYKDASMLTQNDNWGGNGSLANLFAAVGAFPLTVTSLDAALMRTVEGGHTAQVTGPAGGNVLVEAYDAGTGASPRLSNISARNFVGTGGDILIAGFTIAGSSPKNLLIRAVGPTLGAFGVPGTLVAPKLAVYNAAGTVIAENDSWTAALASVFSSVGAFPLTAGSRDAAFTLSLPPGGYTVQVSGSDGGTGEALVELYELP